MCECLEYADGDAYQCVVCMDIHNRNAWVMVQFENADPPLYDRLCAAYEEQLTAERTKEPASRQLMFRTVDFSAPGPRRPVDPGLFYGCVNCPDVFTAKQMWIHWAKREC